MPMTTLEMAKAARLRPGTPGFDAQLARLQAASDAAKARLLAGDGGIDWQRSPEQHVAAGIADAEAGRQASFNAQQQQFDAATALPEKPYYPAVPARPGPVTAEGVAANEAAHRAAVAAMNPANANREAAAALGPTGNDLSWKPETMQTIQNESMVKRLMASGQVPGGGGLSPVERARGIVSEKSRAGQLGGKVGDTWVGPGAVDIVPQPITGQFQTPADVAGMVAPDVTRLNLSGVPDAGGSPRFQVVQRGPDEATQARLAEGPQLRTASARAAVMMAGLQPQAMQAQIETQHAQTEAARAQTGIMQNEVERGKILVGTIRQMAQTDPQRAAQMLSGASPEDQDAAAFYAADMMEYEGKADDAAALRSIVWSRKAGRPVTIGPQQYGLLTRAATYILGHRPGPMPVPPAPAPAPVPAKR